MTVSEAIARVDSLRDNRMSMAEKVRLLSALDGRIKQEVIDTHEGGKNATYPGKNSQGRVLQPRQNGEVYTENRNAEEPYDENDMGRELLVPSPYDELYVRYLDMNVLLHMGEYDKYNVAAQLYNDALKDFKIHYNSTHMPKQVRARVL